MRRLQCDSAGIICHPLRLSADLALQGTGLHELVMLLRHQHGLDGLRSLLLQHRQARRGLRVELKVGLHLGRDGTVLKREPPVE